LRRLEGEEARIPTHQEVSLQRVIDQINAAKEEVDAELADLRPRLAAAEAEVAALRASPLRGPRAWLATKIRSR
jgi:hypothetical protein